MQMVFSENIVNELTAVFTDTTVCAAQTRIKMKDVTNFMFIAQDVEFLRLIILFKKRVEQQNHRTWWQWSVFSVINDYRTLRLSALGKCFVG